MTIEPRAFPPIPWSATIPVSDDTLDISDWWDEEFDLEGDGPHAEALFTSTEEEDSVFEPSGHGLFKERPFTVTVHRLIGATVEDTDEIRFIDRDAVIGIFSAAIVEGFEETMDEVKNDN